MQILLIDTNSTASMTRQARQSAKRVAQATTNVRAVSPVAGENRRGADEPCQSPACWRRSARVKLQGTDAAGLDWKKTRKRQNAATTRDEEREGWGLAELSPGRIMLCDSNRLPNALTEYANLHSGQ